MGAAGTVSVRRVRTRKTMRDKLRTQAQNIDLAGKVSNRLTTASYDVSAWPEQVQPSPQDGRKGARQIENKRKKGRSGGVPNCLTVSLFHCLRECQKESVHPRIGYGAGSEPVEEPMRRSAPRTVLATNWKPLRVGVLDTERVRRDGKIVHVRARTPSSATQCAELRRDGKIVHVRAGKVVPGHVGEPDPHEPGRSAIDLPNLGNGAGIFQ